MIVDGRALAEKIYTQVRTDVAVLTQAPVLTIITCEPNFETQKYLALKETKAQAVGIVTRVIACSSAHTTEDFIHAIDEALPVSDGIIVQLPLPPHVVLEKVLADIPVTHDVDALNQDTKQLLSPVVGAMKEILDTAAYTVKDAIVTVIGSGRLVGLPASQWFMEQGAHVSVVTKDTVDIQYYTKNADILVCGAGVPGLITPDMIKDNVVILDAGTSEDGGALRGDVSPLCAEKALLFTPVPGGIGPVTIAYLLANVVRSALNKD